MNIFEYLITAGVLIFVVTISWNYIASPILTIIVAVTTIIIPKFEFNKDSIMVIATIILRCVSYYFITVVISFITITAIQLNANITTNIFYPIIGMYLVTIKIFESMINNREKNADIILYDSVKYDKVILICFIFLFIISLFIKVLTLNQLTYLILQLLDWLNKISLIGLIFKIAGCVYMLYIIYSVSFSLFIFVLGLFKRSST